MCLAYGSSWRLTRAKYSHSVQWGRDRDTFVNKVCDSWHLAPLPSKPEYKLYEALAEQREPCTLDNQPARVHHDHDVCWSSTVGCVNVVVDCQAVASLMTGGAVLSNPAMRPLFVRLGRALAKLHSIGAQPRCATGSLIEWRPRRFNPVADHYCNMAMDSKTTREQRDSNRVCKAWREGCNLQLYTDGGRRGDGSAALGWTVYAVSQRHGEWWWTQLAWSSMLLSGTALTPFQCEAHALEDGLQFLSNSVARH